MSFKTQSWIQPADQDGVLFDPLPDDHADDHQQDLIPIDKAEISQHHKLASMRQREQIKQRLWEEGEVELGNKLAQCGLPYPLVCVACGDRRVSETQCRRRYCPCCSWAIQQKRMQRYSGAVALMQWPMHLILTQPNSPDPETIRDLRKSWGKMRRRKLIQEKIEGGIAALEITNSGKGWHAHLHAIVDCRWLAIHSPEPTWRDNDYQRQLKIEHARNELSLIWASVIKQPTAIVLAKRAKQGNAAAYVLKYAVKGSDLVSCPDKIGPMISIMQKSRLISAFGNLHGRTKEMDDDDGFVCTCKKCGQEKSIMPEEIISIMTRHDPLRPIPHVRAHDNNPA